MNDGLIPRRYAKALYKFAAEKGTQKRVYELMRSLVKSFDAEPSLTRALENPFVPDADKKALLITASGAADADAAFADFLSLLSKNRRLRESRLIALAYTQIYREENNIYVVKVESAVPLTEAEESRLKSLIKKHLRGGAMEYSSSLNPDLIGGFIVSVGNDRVDASVSNELKQLRLNLISK